MDFLLRLSKILSKQARAKRASIFRELFNIDQNTKILDLGSENGENISRVLEGTGAENKNIYIYGIFLETLEYN